MPDRVDAYHTGHATDLVQGGTNGPAAPFGAENTEFFSLELAHGLPHLEQPRRRGLFDLKLVDADNDPVFCLDLLLVLVGAVGNLSLDVSCFNSRKV